MPLVLSWFAIEWTEDGADAYPGGVVLRDSAGAVLRVSLGEGDVDCRPSYTADPEDWIARAVVASEDGAFWRHRGVRPLSVLRAACQNAFGRRRVSGASTITMQTVRLIRPHPKTFFWKFREAVLALKMERAKDKRWILSQYLNRAPFGSNLVGIEAAAMGWFGKPAKALGLGEAALLAGLVQAPSRFRPDRGLDRALRRRDYVLSRMQALGLVTAEQAEGARSVRPAVCRAPRPFRHPHFCDWALRELKRDGAAGRRGGDFVTTLDADVQALAEAAVRDAAAQGGYSVAAVVQRVETAEVVALACSGDYFSPSAGQVNTALAPRPAGSTLKPFLTALAFDCGLVTPETRLKDVPMSFKGYRPANFDAAYRGSVSVRDALILSLNLPFVQLLDRLGVEAFGTHLRALGFRSDADAGLGLAIGNVEVSLLQLVSAYATLARGGVFCPPKAIRDGAAPQASRVYSAGAAYLVSDILSGTERSGAALGHVADVRAPRLAWKTGTSAAYRDAWTVAWNPALVVGVWCGHLSGGFGDRTLVGAKAAAPVAWRIARGICQPDADPWHAKPDDVVTRTLCAETGLPANPFCPQRLEGPALRGRSSAARCARHRLDADGRTAPAAGGAGTALTILAPEDGALFVRVAGRRQQRIVCQVAGNPASVVLWWFVNGVPAGTTRGTAPFAVEMTPGTNAIACVTAAGDAAAVTFTVRDEGKGRL